MKGAARRWFRTIRWGEEPSQFVDVDVADRRGRSIGRCKAITYCSTKAGASGLWRHVFDEPPLVLDVNVSGEPSSPALENLVCLGAIVSLEMIGTRDRLRVTGGLVLTDAASRQVWIGSITGPAPIQFGRGTWVDRDGIGG